MSLCAEQSLVGRAGRQHIGMRTKRDGSSLLHHQHVRYQFDERRRHGVRHDQRRATTREFSQRLVNKLLAVRIDGRRGFVENQNRRFAQHGSRQSNSLTLAARQALATIANTRLQAIGHLSREVGHARLPRGLFNLGV